MADMSRALKREEGERLHVRDQGVEELLGWLSRDHEIVLLEEKKNALPPGWS